MLFKVIEYFGPGDEKWGAFIKNHYIKNLSHFDSIDGILCPSKFTPESTEDWKNCVNEDEMIDYITNLEYALKVHKKFPKARLVGLECGKNNDRDKTLIGYDIIDGYKDVSLITNWGPHDKNHPLKDFAIQNNGLISNFGIAEQAVKTFNVSHSNDPHVKGCQIWAVHNP